MDDRPDQVRRQSGARGMPEEGVREKLSRERNEINPDPGSTDDELESLRLELARTRSQMSETVYAIQGRMEPQYIREQATSQAKDTAREAGSSVVDTIKDNPIPSALTGAGIVGLGWLIASASGGGSGRSGGYSRSGSSTGYRRQALDDGPYRYGPSERSDPAYHGSGEYEGSGYGSSSESSESSGGRTQEMTGQARQRASQMGGQFQERAGQAGEQAQQQAQRAKGGFQQALRDNPLALGALAIGVGAAVGFVVPATSRENEVMGETRDNLVERGKQSARETRERAQRVLEEGRRSAEEEAQRQDLTSG